MLLYISLGRGKQGTFNKQYQPLDSRTIARYDKTDEKGKRYRSAVPRGSPRERTYLRVERDVGIGSFGTDIPRVTATRRNSRIPRLLHAETSRIVRADYPCHLEPSRCGPRPVLAGAARRWWPPIVLTDGPGIDLQPFAVDLIRNRCLPGTDESVSRGSSPMGDNGVDG